MKLVRIVRGIATVLVLLAIDGCSRSPAAPKTAEILFLGNSYTANNGGLARLWRSFRPGKLAAEIAPGGFSLRSLWTNGNARKVISETAWSWVVLQEQSQVPIVETSSFREYSRKFVEEIRRHGAKPILLMTWERPDSTPVGVTTEGLARAYESMGSELGVTVAPAGRAFAEAKRLRPDLVLNARDGHPTPAGTYLAACVLYATILRASPVGLPDSEFHLDPADRELLQRVAETVCGVSASGGAHSGQPPDTMSESAPP